MMRVAPPISLSRASLRSLSVLESRAENVSSNRYIGGSLQTALAMDTLCFCPPDRFQPCWDTSESMPFGSLSTSSPSWAMPMALMACSSVLSVPP